VTRWNRRARPHAGASHLATVLAVVVATAALGAVPAAAAPGSSTPPTGTGAGTNATIGATQAQAAALESQIAQQQQQLSTLSERYNQGAVHLQEIRADLVQTGAQLTSARQQEASARHELQVAAVNAYMFDTPTTRLNSLFASSANTGELTSEYQDTAIGNVDGAVAQLHGTERQLSADVATLGAQERQASAEASGELQAQQSAQQENAAAQRTLADVQGQLAQLVAQQAAHKAAQAAAAAAAAASEAAKQQAAEQAAQAAQVAQTVGAGTSAASQATNSANQAAGSAGDAGQVGTGSPETPSGPGAVALQAAENFLGVPYQWGGASPSGVDCSGLVMLAWQAAGVDLPHSAAIQEADSTPVALDQVEPGDLLFYDLDGSGVDHVVMYVGSGPYGADTIIQAAHTGTVVSFDPVWYEGLVGAGRP